MIRLFDPKAANRSAETGELDGLAIIDLGPVEILGGADLVRLRENLSRLVVAGRRRVGVDLSTAGHLPPGFFGMLADFVDAGTELYLVRPRPHVRSMRWFRTFAVPAGSESWRLTLDSRDDGVREDEPEDL